MSYATAAAAVDSALNIAGNGAGRWVGATDAAGVEVSGAGYARIPMSGSVYAAYDFWGDSSVAVGFMTGGGWYASGTWDRPVERWQIYTAASGAGTELIVSGSPLNGVLYWNWTGALSITISVFVTAPASTSVVTGKSGWQLGRQVSDLVFTIGATYYVALYDADGVELTSPGYVRKSFTASYRSYDSGSNAFGGLNTGLLLWNGDRAGRDWGRVVKVAIVSASTGGTLLTAKETIFGDGGVRLNPTDDGLLLIVETVSTPTTPGPMPSVEVPTVIGGPSLANARRELVDVLAGVWVGVLRSDLTEPTNATYERIQPVWNAAAALDPYGDGYYLRVSTQYIPFLASDTWVDLQRFGLWSSKTGGTAPVITGLLGLGDSSGAQNPILNVLRIFYDRLAGYSLDSLDSFGPSYGTVPTIATPVLTVNSVADTVELLGASVPFAATSATAIDQMDFAVDGATVASDATGPYGTTWTATAGVHTVKATAVLSGYGAQSAPSTVTVLAAPTCALLTPAGGWTTAVNNPVRLGAEAFYDAGVTSVEFEVNFVSVGVSTTFPYSIVHVPLAVGTFVVRATATTAGGAVQSSSENLIVTAAPTFQPGGWGRQT